MMISDKKNDYCELLNDEFWLKMIFSDKKWWILTKNCDFRLKKDNFWLENDDFWISKIERIPDIIDSEICHDFIFMFLCSCYCLIDKILHLEHDFLSKYPLSEL